MRRNELGHALVRDRGDEITYAERLVPSAIRRTPIDRANQRAAVSEGEGGGHGARETLQWMSVTYEQHSGRPVRARRLSEERRIDRVRQKRGVAPDGAHERDQVRRGDQHRTRVAQRGQGERSSQQIAEPFAYVGAMAVNDRTMSSQRGDDAEIGVVDVQQVVRSGASLEIDPHKLGDPKRQRSDLERCARARRWKPEATQVRVDTFYAKRSDERRPHVRDVVHVEHPHARVATQTRFALLGTRATRYPRSRSQDSSSAGP